MLLPFDSLKIRTPLKAGVLMLSAAILSACQSTAPALSGDTPKAGQMFQAFSAQEASPQQKLVAALNAHLKKERTAVSSVYYQEVPMLAEDSLNAGADPLAVTLIKMQDTSSDEYEEDSSVFRHNSDYLENGEELPYLRYYDEMDGTTPMADYHLNRLEGLDSVMQERDVKVHDLAEEYSACVQALSYAADGLVKKNPAVTVNDGDFQSDLQRFDGCVTKLNERADELLKDSVGYQVLDIHWVQGCASHYRENLTQALARGRHITRYEGADYDAYDSVYGNYALCHAAFEAGYKSDPGYYLGDFSKTRLEMIRHTRLCAVNAHERTKSFVANGQTYATDPKAFEENFYRYFSCLDDALGQVYRNSETGNDVLRSNDAPTSMAEAQSRYELHVKLVADEEETLYAKRDDESRWTSGLERYFKMKESELAKEDKDEPETPRLRGVSGIYGAMASEVLDMVKRTPEQMRAKNVYEYDNSVIRFISHHHPTEAKMTAVMAFDFESPTAKQSYRVPFLADFGKGEVTADLSMLLPVGAFFSPKQTPLPEEFGGQVGMTQFKLPAELSGIIPTKLIYQSVQTGYGRAMAELNPLLFTYHSVSDDAFAKSVGASTAVRLQLSPNVAGEVLSLVSKQLVRDLSAYVDDNPHLYDLKPEETLGVAEELAFKKRQERASAIKEAIRKWALLDKGYMSGDMGGAMSLVFGLSPLGLSQVSYYYFDSKGTLVGQRVRADVDNRMQNSRTQTLVTTSYRQQDFLSHPLAQTLNFSEAAFDGNAWLQDVREDRRLERDARYARYAYNETERSLAEEKANEEFGNHVETVSGVTESETAP
ncbi:MAG: hypothetical protein Q4B88_05665 [Moraxella sp.]|nr:hypothetical protein [Moraxella sp.]